MGGGGSRNQENTGVSNPGFTSKPPLARGLAFLYFSGLYYVASGGAILAIVTLMSVDPWSVDARNTRELFGIPSTQAFATWLDTQPGAREFIALAYRFSTICMLSASLTLLVIVLLAGKNRNAVLGAQAVVVSCLSLLACALYDNPVLATSVHRTHFIACLVSNGFGLVAHMYERFMYPNLHSKQE